ncbi:ABC transporter ATP-binding protein [Halopenitus persicus]|uniref:ABC transporter ATP-binding protein n=1 Tax=Halopenitus persicus TaxID=1048396 RepID=UPI000BBAE67E|nr:ABC transporter ATP-binding protein [Halopenitus persicus]
MTPTLQQTEPTSSSDERKAVVTLDSIVKEFGDVTAVDDVSIEVRDGEFFSIVGPSGCGKTTTLRMIAGFERPTRGRIHLEDEDVSQVPAYERDIGMVFQGYALFPHKTVGENVAFGLKMQGVPEEEREKRVADILSLVNLPGTEDRNPTELSGGQQQRIALARALVVEPSVLLLDEPLSNLDRKLREEMRFELKRIQDELGITTIYVTHDQEEAMSMSDRILVLNKGEMEQIGEPYEIYHGPSNQFVADFIGDINALPGTIVSKTDSQYTVELDDTTDVIDLPRSVSGRELQADTRVNVNVRPADSQLDTKLDEGISLQGTIEAINFLGKSANILIDVNGREFLVQANGRTAGGRYQPGDSVTVNWKTEASILLQES